MMDDIPANPTVRPASADAHGRRQRSPRVVAIGAGAGGIEAAQLLFGALPIEAGLAFVVCRRVQPGLCDPLAELLRNHTAMPVIAAENGMLLEAGRIYLAAPDAHMIVLKDRLVAFDLPGELEDHADGGEEVAPEVSPIDLLLHSLAASAGPAAIAVMLSGNGRDGLRGCASIRGAGGVVLAQHPESTEFAALPQAVIAADLASDVAPPAALADLIRRHLGKGLGAETDPAAAGLGEDRAIARIAARLKDRLAIDIAAYRPVLVAKGLRRRFAMSGVATLADYAELLAADDDELSALGDDLMVRVTGFFRDPEAFAVLDREVAPSLIERMSEARPIRIWVPACASGEEAYSLAMLMLDRIERAGKPPHLEVLASDLHVPVLKRARFGRYRRDRLGDLPPELAARYLHDAGVRAGGARPGSTHVEVGPRLRRHVTFIDHDILKAPSPDDIDLVSCRNLLIYLAAGAREQALLACTEALRPAGFLFLGPSEQPGVRMADLVTVHAKWRIYRKTAPAAVDDALVRLAASKDRAPAETLLPDGICGAQPPASSSSTAHPPERPDALGAAGGAASRGELEGVMAENQRMLESTIDTLLASNDTLRRRNRDLRAENRRLAGANAALDDVATMIAHDLKAPLRTADKLSQRLETMLDERVSEPGVSSWLQPLRLQLGALERLTDDLLIYARQGRADAAELESVDVGDLLRETLTLIGLPTGIKVLMQPPSLQVTTWRIPLACILRNLLGQAIERIGRASGNIRIDAASTGCLLEMTIADDGRHHLDRASGLGLAIVRQLLDASGGRMTSEADAAIGHRLRFTWPIESTIMADDQPSAGVE